MSASPASRRLTRPRRGSPGAACGVAPGAARGVAPRAAVSPVALALAAALTVALGASCGGGPARPAAGAGSASGVAPAGTARAAELGPLTVPLVALVPEGADLAVVARPAALLEVPALASLVEAVAPDDRLQAFALRTGVDLRRLREAVVADYGARGSLWLARGPFDAPLAVAEVAERLATVESRADAPLPRCAGFLGNERVEVVALAPDALVVARGEGAVGPLGELLACRRGRRCRPAFAPDTVRSLLRAHASAPLAVYAPRGVELPEGFGAEALVAGALAGVAAVGAGRPEVARAATLTLDLRGRFPATAAENFRSLLRAVAASELAGAFGLGHIGETGRVEVGPDRVTIELDLDAAAFRVGLRALAGAGLAELLDAAEPLDATARN